MNWLEVPVFASFVLYLATAGRPSGLLTADALFCYFQLVMVAGTFPLLDETVRADVVYGYVLAYAFVSYTLACIFFHFANFRMSKAPPLPRVVRRIVVTRPGVGVWTLIALSLVVVIAYYVAVGYSTLVVGLRDQLTGTSGADIATLRLNSYSGSRYLAAGYVNQIKNALLPALVIVVVTYLSSTRMHHRIAITAAILVTTLGIVGAGQRGGFVIVVGVAVEYLWLLDRGKFRRRLKFVVLFAAITFALSTLALGRNSSEASTTGGLPGRIASIVGAVWSRIMVSNQHSGVAGFRYTFSLPTQYGRDWFDGLMTVLPGPFKSRGPGLDNYIFASLYGGSLRGTSPPSLWGSVYYNFGLVGIVAAPIIFAFVLRFISDKTLSRDLYNTMELIGMSGVFVCVASWVADGPIYLANAGILVYLLVWAFGRRQLRRWRASGSEGSSVTPVTLVGSESNSMTPYSRMIRDSRHDNRTRAGARAAQMAGNRPHGRRRIGNEEY